MTGDDEGEATLPPDEAFAVLGNEARVQILQALGTAEGPLPFSRLHDRVDVRDSGQFNYHLEKLVGHFVEKTDEGYSLRYAGRRVVEAVLSGAVTESPDLPRTEVDEACEYCGAPIEVQWTAGSLELFCTECEGTYGRSYSDDKRGRPADRGYLGRLPLPPAGLQHRTPTEVLRAGWTWGTLELLAMANGICPRCSATIDQSVSVCSDHDASDGRCGACGNAHAVVFTTNCTNCIFQSGGAFIIRLLATTELLAFLTSHDYNPLRPDSLERLMRAEEDYEEEVLSTEPFRARFTFHVDGDSLALTVDEDLTVVGVEESSSGA